jgi:ABC-type dipeptide/oligopeptide/nickel transport system ATPase component
MVIKGSKSDIGVPVRKDGDKDNRFCLFAVRVNSDKSQGQRKLQANEPYYLMKGFRIKDDLVYIDKHSLHILKSDMFGQTFSDMPKYKPAVNISAIVGENGSGKSTLVEYIIRLLNNLSASAFGEIKQSDSSDRLHYIDGVDGELFYMQYGRVYSVLIKNDAAILRAFKPVRELCNSEYEVQKPLDDYYNNLRPGLAGPHDLFPPLGNINHFDSLFYTIVSNHSIYAYNTNDYAMEADSNEREKRAETLYRRSYTEQKNRIGRVKDEYSIDERCWLHGLFHKNDGYQVPIVLTPFRKEGAIDINNENRLVNERLVALIVDKKSTFRNINDHLIVESLSLKRSDKEYNYERVRSSLKLSFLTSEAYVELRIKIKKIWWEALGLLPKMGEEKRYYNDAIDYLTYKTIKTSSQYPQYRFFYRNYKKSDCRLNEEDLTRLIDQMLLDSSHITAKIFQTLAYLAYDVYTDEVIDRPVIPEHLKAGKYPLNHNGKKIMGLQLVNMQKEKLLPPPFFDVTINLRDQYTDEMVPFESISSGEKQLTYAVSSLLYHLVNIESVSSDNNGIRILYDHVNIILEEIELYFHPDLQKRFVKYLLGSLNAIKFENLKGLNIILVTHSPFVLSDIPSSNILALNKDGSQGKEVLSFGANIHEMLADSFFLQDGAIGDFSKWYISKIIEDLSTDNTVNSEELHRRIMIIDEPIVRMTLLEQYHKKFPNYDRKLREQELLKELEEIRKNDVEA